MTIRVIRTPHGDSPQEIREAWIGTTLPIVGRRARRQLTYDETQGHRNLLWVTLLATFRIGKFQRVYTVHAKTAVDILAQHRPEAADWWRQNTPHVLGRFRYLGFQEDVCVVESLAYVKPHASAAVVLFITLTLGLLFALVCFMSARDLYAYDVGSYWDAARNAWVPVSEATMRQGLFGDLVILALLAVPASFALVRYLRYNRWSNRIWRGQCGWCGYDVRQTPERCPECNEPVTPNACSKDAPTRGMDPGTKANLKLLWIFGAAVLSAAGIVALLMTLAGDGG
jgi:hypothetical protein